MTRPDKSLTAAGNALRTAREQRGLNIETLSAESGVPAIKLAAYEAGTAEVTLVEVCVLAKAMGTTASDIFRKAGI